jgi:hypothetical protein
LLEKKHFRCAKKPKKSYEASRKFQDSWAVKPPWVKMVVSVNGKYEGVVSICSDVMGIDEILAPKWDTWKKHGGQHKAKRNMVRGIKKGHRYLATDYKHL